MVVGFPSGGTDKPGNVARLVDVQRSRLIPLITVRPSVSMTLPVTRAGITGQHCVPEKPLMNFDLAAAGA